MQYRVYWVPCCHGSVAVKLGPGFPGHGVGWSFFFFLGHETVYRFANGCNCIIPYLPCWSTTMSYWTPAQKARYRQKIMQVNATLLDEQEN
jgi:hypothetical protein